MGIQAPNFRKPTQNAVWVVILDFKNDDLNNITTTIILDFKKDTLETISNGDLVFLENILRTLKNSKTFYSFNLWKTSPVQKGLFIFHDANSCNKKY